MARQKCASQCSALHQKIAGKFKRNSFFASFSHCSLSFSIFAVSSLLLFAIYRTMKFHTKMFQFSRLCSKYEEVSNKCCEFLCLDRTDNSVNELRIFNKTIMSSSKHGLPNSVTQPTTPFNASPNLGKILLSVRSFILSFKWGKLSDNVTESHGSVPKILTMIFFSFHLFLLAHYSVPTRTATDCLDNHLIPDSGTVAVHDS